MIVLDTNVISEVQKSKPEPAVVKWLETLETSSVFICAPVLMEQAYGAERHFLKHGSRRYADTAARLGEQFKSRILGMDIDTFARAGTLRAKREFSGRQISLGDAMIAAICLMNGATLATRNVRDFDGLDLELINPFETAHNS